MSSEAFFIHNLLNQTSFEIKDEMTIGRGSDNDIVIADDKISGKHLQFFLKEEAAYVQDMGTRNGTTINGIQAKPYENYELFEQSKILIGKNIIVFSHSNEIDFEDYEDEIEELKAQSLSEKTTSRLSKFDKEIGLSIALEKSKKDNFTAKDSTPDQDLKKEIKALRNKVAKIQDEILKIDQQTKARNELSVDIEDLEKKIAEEEPLISKFKSKFDKHAAEWERINKKIKMHEKELNELYKQRKPMEKVMQPYEDFNSMVQKKHDMQVELKTIIRSNLEQKKIDYQNRIVEVEEQINRNIKELARLDAAKEQEKFKERQKIKAQIAELQAKLDKTG